MIPKAIEQAFCEERRSKELPLVYNDDVIVLEGAWRGTIAYVISIVRMQPEPEYLVEYEDGSSEVRKLHELKFDEAL